MAKFVVVTAAERIIRLLPRGAHDPHMFIRPQELGALCASAGLSITDLAGLGPIGVDRRLDIRFGKVPINWVQYMGVAEKPTTKEQGRTGQDNAQNI